MALIGEAGPEAIVGMQGGGIVNKPTLALLGEAGPEAVVPLSRGRAPLPPNVPGPSRSSIQIPHTAEQMAGWQQYFTNPLADIESEMQAARSTARGSIAGIGKQGSFGGEAFQAGRAAWDVLGYGMSPIGAVEHTTLGRVAGGAVGGRAAGNIVSDVVSPFIPYTPSGGIASALEGTAAVAQAANLLSLSGRTAQRLMLGGKAAQAGATGGMEGMRSLLDRKQGAALQGNQTGSGDITVEVPGDALANPTGEGLFKPQKISRQTQMEKARQGPSEEGVFIPSDNSWGRGERIYTSPGGGIRG